MRLLDTTTLKLHSFSGRDATPDYAILSHRWDDEEVSYQDLESGRGTVRGYAKIDGCCKQARSDGWKYVWIDSCCIDKTSSAELSESINSMYQWYKNAQVCYAFLRDVDSQAQIYEGLPAQSQAQRPASTGRLIIDPDTPKDTHRQFRNSEWFNRGWTLQELLAPSLLVFFDCNWIDIGTKSSLQDSLSEITGIEDFLFYEGACVAQKMSWAAGRKTTRAEDEAYCLMGLFGVNMPLLYGEGNNAFIRLQHEIIKASDDESIFAWSSKTGHGSLFAESPRAFLSSGQVRPMPKYSPYTVTGLFKEKHPFSMTNLGLQMHLYIIPVLALRGAISDSELFGGRLYADTELNLLSREFVVPLNCTWTRPKIEANIFDKSDGKDLYERVFVPAVFLRRDDNGIYRRAHCRELLSVDLNRVEKHCALAEQECYTKNVPAPVRQMVFVKGNNSSMLYGISSRKHEADKIVINATSLLKFGFKNISHHPASTKPTRGAWRVDRDPIFVLSAAWEDLEAIYPELHFENGSIKKMIVLVVGSSRSHSPWLFLMVLSNYTDISRGLVSNLISPNPVKSVGSWWRPRSNSLDVIASSDSEDSISYDFGELSMKKSSKAPGFIGVDRISVKLDSYFSISTSLKPVTKGGKLQFVVDMEIDPKGTIRWPAPTRSRLLEAQVADRLLHINGGDANVARQESERMNPESQRQDIEAEQHETRRNNKGEVSELLTFTTFKSGSGKDRSHWSPKGRHEGLEENNSRPRQNTQQEPRTAIQLSRRPRYEPKQDQEPDSIYDTTQHEHRTQSRQTRSQPHPHQKPNSNASTQQESTRRRSRQTRSHPQVD